MNKTILFWLTMSVLVTTIFLCGIASAVGTGIWLGRMLSELLKAVSR